jgi:hypothetical protein
MGTRTSIAAACFAAFLTALWPADSASTWAAGEDPNGRAEEFFSPHASKPPLTGGVAGDPISRRGPTGRM